MNISPKREKHAEVPFSQTLTAFYPHYLEGRLCLYFFWLLPSNAVSSLDSGLHSLHLQKSFQTGNQNNLPGDWTFLWIPQVISVCFCLQPH